MIIRIYSLIILFSLLGFVAHAQEAMNVYGPTVVNKGGTANYGATLNISDPANPNPDFCFTVSGGTFKVINDGCKAAGEPDAACMKCRTIEVTWNGSVSKGSVSVTTSNGYSATLNNIIIVIPIKLSDITPQLQDVKYNTAPTAFTMPVPTGGDGTFTYAWQRQNDDLNWETISGATGTGYTPPALTRNTYYRVAVTSFGATVYSKRVTVNVRKPFNPGEIYGYQRVAASAQPLPIKGEPAVGEAGTFNYQWQQSADKNTWTDISGAVVQYYTPAPATTTKYYRRKVVSVFSTGNTTAYSNISTVAIAGNEAGNTPASTQTGYTQPLLQQADITGTLTPYNSSSTVEYDVLKANVKDAAGIAALATKEAAVRKTWYDGLGRDVQGISVQTTSRNKDMVQQMNYDDLGRVRQQYLPYVDSLQIGQLRTTAGTRQQAFYKQLFPQENFFYSRSIADGGGNMLSNTIPGNSWSGSNVGSSGFKRALNREQVVRWILVNDTTPAMAAGADRYYDAGEIEVEESIDVYGRRGVRYRDRQGMLLEEATQTGTSSWLYQYYVYNDLGRMIYEISPKAVKWIQDNNSTIPTATVWNLDTWVKRYLCTGYRFDETGRCIARRDPGVEESVVVYDKKDRPLLTQTAIQREAGQWSYMVYDMKGHIVISGIYKNTSTRDQLQAQIDQASAGAGTLITLSEPAAVDLALNQYTGKSLYEAKNSITLLPGFETGSGAETVLNINPSLADQVTLSQVMVEQDYLGLTTSANATPLNYNYYDNYDFPGAANKAFNTASIGKLKGGTEAVTPERALMTNGFITGSRIKVFYPGAVTGPEWITTVNYYDRTGKIIQTQVDNILNGTDIESTAYSYAGRVISTHTYHYNPVGIPNKQMDIVKRYSYYDNGQLQQSWMTINNNAEQPMETDFYNDLGKLSKRVIGKGIESLDYTYDINGLLKGINADYAENAAGNHYFGTALHHNEGYSNIQLDGSITGVTWRRKGVSDAAMSYGYQYDGTKRLAQAYFTQNKGGGWSQSEKDFTVDNMQYDENGNIISMRSKSSYLGMTKAVDDLSYTYQPNTNKLLKVNDAAGDNQQQDFKDGSNGTTDDYGYSNSGALTADANKNIQLEWNNMIEKPVKITFDNNPDKSISYVYDASGYRWQKIVKNGSITDVYTYNGNFLYKNDTTLVQFSNETGRVRLVKQTNSGAYAFVNDYFISDHLGNVRTVLTEEKDTAIYKSTFEAARDGVEEALFTNRAQTIENIPTNYPFYNSTTNKQWSKLNGGDPSKRVGTSLVLKVMAGDTINIAAKAYYKQMAASNTGAGLNDMISSMVNAILGSGSSVIDNGHGNLVQGNNAVLNTAAMNSFLNQKQQENNTPQTYPKAYVNYVLFDEDFNMVSGSVLRINKGSDVLQDYIGYLEIPKNGFLYVYESNESPVDVWFDDLTVSHRNGPLLQENTLYPYGLGIAAQSSRSLMKAANELVYQGKELDEEFSLYFNYFDNRYYDPQLGRFVSIDPGRQFANGYMGMGNNPAMFVDPDGRFIWVIVGIGAALGAFSGYSIAKAKGAQGFWQWFGYIGGGAVIGGASAWAGSAVGAAAGIGLTNASGVVAHAGLYAAMIGGATGGAISGLGFGVLSGSDNLLKSTAIGAVSGAVGGGVGALVSGGAGAFAGGFSGGLISSSLSGGGDFGSILKSGLVSGAIAWGAYQVNASINYKAAKSGLSKGGVSLDLTRKQYNILTRLIQRSFVSGREFGGWINDDGTVSWQKTHEVGMDLNESAKPTQGSISFHTHPGNGPQQSLGHSNRFEFDPNQGMTVRQGDIDWDFRHGTSSIVFGRTAVWFHDMFDLDALYISQNIFNIKYFNPYPFNTFLSR